MTTEELEAQNALLEARLRQMENRYSESQKDTSFIPSPSGQRIRLADFAGARFPGQNNSRVLSNPELFIKDSEPGRKYIWAQRIATFPLQKQAAAKTASNLRSKKVKAVTKSDVDLTISDLEVDFVGSNELVCLEDLVLVSMSAKTYREEYTDYEAVAINNLRGSFEEFNQNIDNVTNGAGRGKFEQSNPNPHG